MRSYYGRPVLKEPVWKVPDVPAYLYLGGMAGASSTMALLAGLTGRERLARAGRLAAAVGATTSVAALMHDLHRPMRFLNMLRVFKPTSPLSVGSWILAPFSGLAGAAAAGDVTGLLPGPSRAAGVVAGAIAPAMTTYTAVLLADTAVPGWHEGYRELPFVFAGSALTSAGAVGMVGAPAEAGPARRMAVAGAVLELAASRRMESRMGLAAEAYRTGRAGGVLRAARAATAAGAALALSRRRPAGLAAGALLTLGAIATRYGVFEAGRVTARDPRFVVEPQRERVSEPGTSGRGEVH
ncbi:NrfD/PsrC family molybdoenzyme membrane anchor subunit [Saccharopolyspora sp. ID03-671]|uniref:NrfD/PsrC family molybdoenzyme membrane anchor subunit n=1 Tax=Saccharopolyspora sp. ID03-671 TaxID=3073066 RepID=UPI003250ACFB